MKLQEVVDEYKKGGPKGIRRKKWDPGTWLKLNDYGCQDDLYFVSDGEKGNRGYTLNVMDFVADDWEVVT